MAEITQNDYLTGGQPRSSWTISLADVKRRIFERDVPVVEKTCYSRDLSQRPLAAMIFGRTTDMHNLATSFVSDLHLSIKDPYRRQVILCKCANFWSF